MSRAFKPSSNKDFSRHHLTKAVEMKKSSINQPPTLSQIIELEQKEKPQSNTKSNLDSKLHTSKPLTNVKLHYLEVPAQVAVLNSWRTLSGGSSNLQGKLA